MHNIMCGVAIVYVYCIVGYELELTTFEDLPPGPHHLKVMHDRSRCPERRKLSVSFVVE